MLNPLLNKSKKQDMMREEDIPLLHHNLMKVYGWIPLKEFKELPPHVVLTLNKLVQEELKHEYEYKKAVLRGLGHRVN